MPLRFELAQDEAVGEVEVSSGCRPTPIWRTRLFIGMGNMDVAPTPLCCFYRATETGIEILRILHGARDLPPLLEDS